jgi:hypothetical protein
MAGWRQQLIPSAVVEELLATRTRIGQMAADALGSSVMSVVTRNEEILSSSIGLAVAETVSRAALGDSMITANLAAVSVGRYVREWTESLAVANTLTKQLSAQFSGMTQVAQLVQQQNQQLLRFHPSWEIAQPASLSTRAFQHVLQTSAPDRTGALLPRVEIAGRTTSWALDASMRLTVPTIGEDLEEATESALGPTRASSELRARLAAIDSDLPTKLDGAWERIDNGGSDAGGQAAHSLMEAVDWTLRLLAPVDEVLAWYAVLEPKPSNALDDKTRPTRALKLRYIVRDHPGKAFATDLYIRAIGGLVSALQDPKHESRTTDPRTLAPIAQTVEGFLLFVVSD